MRPRRKRPHKPLLFTLGSLANRWASIVVRSHYEFRIDPSIPSTDRAAADGQHYQRDHGQSRRLVVV